MRIADFRVTPIAISDPPLLNAAGLHAPYALRVIVEVVSDDNISGEACDTHYPWQCEEVVVGGRLQFDDGDLVVGDAPGLGIELDRAMLAKLHANYIKCGLTKRDDEAEMQKVQPG